MNSKTYYQRCLPLAVTLLLAATAAAQNTSETGQPDDKQEKESDANDGVQSRDQAKNNRSSQSDKNTKDYRLQPRGWVHVATDYDNDGAYDAVETIYYFDLQKARERSKRRARKDQHARGDTNSATQQRFARRTRVRGEITQLKTVKSPRSDKNNLIAKVQTPNDRIANVCLGPEQGVAKLDLRKGDKISVSGVLTRMNDQPTLLAARVKANGETVNHKLTRRKGISRHAGELVSLRSAESRRGDGKYYVARIDTGEETKTVHLGPEEQLSKLELSEGDEVSVLTRSGRVSGKSALIALQVDANDKTVKVVRPRARVRNARGDG